MPSRPAWTTASAGSPSVRTSTTGMQSAASTSSGRQASSVHSASPRGSRPPARARFTVAPCTWRLSASLLGSVPVAEHRIRRFSATCLGSSAVRRPRFSDSYGPSLTPPVRVEKTTSYGPGASQRRSSGTDQLPGGGGLGVAPVELAVQLPAAELREHLPHPGRLAEAELGEVGAGDLEAHVAQAAEVVVQRLDVGERERVQRGVRCIRLREPDDLVRREALGA